MDYMDHGGNVDLPGTWSFNLSLLAQYHVCSHQVQNTFYRLGLINEPATADKICKWQFVSDKIYWQWLVTRSLILS